MRGSEVTDDQHIKQATSSYNGFAALIKWGSIACAIVVGLIILIIS